jgi:sialate O-acetylesterase
MNFPLAEAKDGDAEIAAADHPEIRFFKSPQRSRYSPASLPEGTWEICSPESVRRSNLSAVAYFFARKIQAETGVPIGIVQAAVGGTPAESWMSGSALQRFDQFAAPLAQIAQLRKDRAPQYGNYVTHWYDQYDIGARGRTWADPAVENVPWKQVSVPGAFHMLGLADYPAVVWLRRELTLPDPLPAGPVHLHLGSIEKMDTAYLNGECVGASAWVENPRIYTIPAKALKPGKNLLALRVFKVASHDGFLSPPETLALELGDGARIPLAGASWEAAVSVDARPPHPLPRSFENWPVMPTVLYRGMIEPLAPLALCGAIWYQGEANASRAWEYRQLLPALIADWRVLFHQPDLPFYIVQLPAFMARTDRPVASDWAELRDAQAFTARTVPHTGLAVTIDSGDADNIHPKDKKIVGDRVALLAQKDIYARDVISTGPQVKSVHVVDGTLRIEFSNTADGLVLRGNTSPAFALAGEDHRWFWARARLDGRAVILTSPDVPRPVAARYAWQSNPPATLFNAAGLPASPFRTDDWPLSTEKN